MIKVQFSVIIPTRNHPGALLRCLQSFTDLDFPEGEWELIVVNDGGADSFRAITNDFRDRLPLQTVDVDHAGPASARNAGAELGRGSCLAFTDDDCRVETDWLRQFAKGFEDDRWDALGGQSLNPVSDSAVATAWHHLVDFLYGYMQDENGNALQLVSNNVAYRRAVYEALGGFDGSFPFAGGEDTEFGYRLITRGYRQRYYPDAKIWHFQRQLTVWGYISQQFRYGRGYFYFLKSLKTGRTHQQNQPELGSRKRYPLALMRSLLHARVPLSVWLLIWISQLLATPSGIFYQAIRARMDLE